MENEEIDLIEVVAKLWQRKRIVFKFVGIFLAAGALAAFLLPRKYTAECTLGLEPEDRTTRISVEGMSAFESMNVADIRQAKNIAPSMYPDILFSAPFLKELIYTPLYTDADGRAVTFYNYLIGREPDSVSRVTQGVEVLNAGERMCMDYLKDAVTLTVNSKEGSLKIAVDMPEAKLAAHVADLSQSMLQRYIARFRMAKAQAAFDFIEERYEEVKRELERKQQALIDFHEQHGRSSSVHATTEEKILANDYDLFFSLYSDVARQREKARIQVKEDMPVLTVVEPVVEPAAPSKPQRALILLASLFLGLFCGCGWVLVSPIFREIRGMKSHRLARMQKVS